MPSFQNKNKNKIKSRCEKLPLLQKLVFEELRIPCTDKRSHNLCPASPRAWLRRRTAGGDQGRGPGLRPEAGAGQGWV